MTVIDVDSHYEPRFAPADNPLAHVMTIFGGRR